MRPTTRVGLGVAVRLVGVGVGEEVVEASGVAVKTLRVSETLRVWVAVLDGIGVTLGGGVKTVGVSTTTRVGVTVALVQALDNITKTKTIAKTDPRNGTTHTTFHTATHDGSASRPLPHLPARSFRRQRVYRAAGSADIAMIILGR